MTVEYDSKGKFYTKLLRKDTLRARIQMPTHQILGEIHLKRGDRVKDELELSEQFLAITEVEIYDLTGQRVHAAPFITINRDHIIWLLLEDEE